jgi:hypothetical protein
MLLRAIAAVAAWEATWWAVRTHNRSSTYQCAARRAAALGRPLLVVGAPDGGVTSGYGCGDLTLDLTKSSCPNHIQADITKQIPLNNDSVVVFVSCVLEYVNDLDAAMRELVRVSGGNLFITRVEPWTLTAYLYPGAKRTIPASLSSGGSCTMIQARSGLVPKQ